ncbi:hypothetical protein ONS95_007906 [Cadophora gregata]|uniref:uncharacterized protein n=1 Tax=Cadophora gregata TaxID=51156 RepID=UPI0026DB2F22|nr:uncharacterized protein ONS95_007906 [Cadophora gregata]KAK0126295.1 hypothetical protein ONS95_007906 [Cadophora gregata]
MYNNTAASSDPNGKPSQFGPSRRTIGRPGPMQASSSNKQRRLSNSYMGNPPFQPEEYATAQIRLESNEAWPYLPAPENSINNYPNYDPGQVSVCRTNNPVIAYQSSETPGSSQLIQSSLPYTQTFPCLAGTPDTVCVCQTCRINTSSQELLGPIGVGNQMAAVSSQQLGIGPGAGSTGLLFQGSIPSLETSRPSSFTTYNQTDSGISQYVPLSNSHLQIPYDNSSTTNFNSSLASLPNGYGFWGPSNIDQSFSSLLTDRGAYQPMSIMPQARDLIIPPEQQNTQQGFGFGSIVSQKAERPSCTDFLEAQRRLNAEFKNDLTATPKDEENFAASIGISAAQLQFCISARLQLLPRIEDMVVSSYKHGIPPEYTAEWYREVHSANQPSNRGVHDSAYQSRPSTSKNHFQSRKRQKRPIKNANREKPYQCTRIKSDGTYCLKENIHLADWKRHEETHWPQRRWECIINDSNGNVACHICGTHIDLAGQHSNSHNLCLGNVLRIGHDFHRKDKLIDHVRQAHGCNANVEAWYVDVNSDWKRQCGFCGETFINWDTRCAHVSRHFTAGMRMIQDWKDPWTKDHENQGQPPDEGNDDDDDDSGSDGNGNGPKHDLNSNNNNNMNNSRTGYNPRNGPGSGNGKRSTRSHESTSGHEKDTQNDGQEMHYSSDLADGVKSEEIESTEQSEDRNPCPATTKSLTDQKTTSGFEFVRRLGYGSFGTVDEVLHTSTKTYFARKSIRPSLNQSPAALFQAQREVVALCSLRHVHIIGVVAYYTFGDQFSIIMSPVAEGNLSEYMFNDCSAPLIKSSNLSKWIGCLISAVSYMHEKSWQHLDIKPSNVLVTGGHVMLSDFGGALPMEDPRSAIFAESRCAVTLMYCAPELAFKSRKPVRTGASDIYSLGCVFLEMATIIHRQSLKSFEQLRAFDTGNGSYHINPRKSWTWIHHLWDIDEDLGLNRQHGLHVISSMLSDDPRKRPTARYIEDSYHYYKFFTSQHEDKGVEEENYLIITTPESSRQGFDPMNIARRWLTNCSTNHKSCSRSSRDFFPSRILNVGTDSNFIHLQSSNDFPSPYVALSHCWGAGNILKTTSKTLRAMTQGIEISSLSNAFSDAVRITRALGLKYLWIDALCILQDRIDDWVSESSQMHMIYSHSSLTICLASDGNSGYGGKQPLAEKQKVDESSPMCLTCSKGYNEFEHLCEDTPTTMLLDSPWSKRAWTLQERILSPRVLYYSSTRMAWECGGNRTTLDIVSRMRENLKTLSVSTTVTTSRKRCWDTPLTKPSQEFNKLWRDIVKEYTNRQLTFPKDKLPALAGVAAEIASLSGQKYLAGLWSDDLIHSILWCRDFATTPLPPPSQYRAPSWSWAAIDSPVTWPKAMLEFPDDEEAKIISWKVIPQWARSPFGQVSSGGSLAIQGSMQKVLIERSQPQTILDLEARMPFAFAQWDCLEPQHYERSCQNRRKVLDELWCLRILSGAGLLLREMNKGEPDTFQRVGLYRIHDNLVKDASLGNIRHGIVRIALII